MSDFCSITHCWYLFSQTWSLHKLSASALITAESMTFQSALQWSLSMKRRQTNVNSSRKMAQDYQQSQSTFVSGVEHRMKARPFIQAHKIYAKLLATERAASLGIELAHLAARRQVSIAASRPNSMSVRSIIMRKSSVVVCLGESCKASTHKDMVSS